MAYQNVGTPRIYINAMEWASVNGAITLPHDVFRTLPVNPVSPPAGAMVIPTPHAFYNNLNYYYMVLGHSGTGVTASKDGEDIFDGWLVNDSHEYDGWYLHEAVEFPNQIDFAQSVGNFGSILIGTYYNMPHSPDLSLTMEREYGGIKTMETKGGASLSNAYYTKPPMWGGLGAWELSNGTMPEQKLSHSGRRIWNLSFSFLSDSNLFPEISNLNNYDSTEYYANDVEQNTLLQDDNFYSQVIHKTNGGQLPFIFQPDKSNFNPDQFAICKFDMKSFALTQTAPNLYNMGIKIREVW